MRASVAVRHGTSRSGSAGFTLVEAGIVLSVTLVLAGLAAPSLADRIANRRLAAAAASVADDLRLARSEALARRTPMRFSVRPYPAGSCYVVHTGAAAQCDCAGDRGAATCRGGAVPVRTVRLDNADGVTLQSNVGSLLFDPQRGTTSPTGTLRVVGRSGRAVHHVVNLLGRVRSCAPNGVAGFRPC